MLSHTMTTNEDTNYLYMFCDTDTYKIGTTKHSTKDKIISDVHSAYGRSFVLVYYRKIYSSGEVILQLLSKHLIDDQCYKFDRCTNIIYKINEQMLMECEEYKRTLTEERVPIQIGNQNPDYAQGKIYVMRKVGNDTDVYVGSTVQPLLNRLEGHMFESKRSPGVKLYTTIGNDWKNWYIELYENYPTESRQQLHRREGEVQRILCSNLNTMIAGRTHKEYAQENREKINEKAKQYYHQNVDKVRAYNSDIKNKAKRYVSDLNKNAICFDKSRKETIEKYKIYKNDDGVYCSELLER